MAKFSTPAALLLSLAAATVIAPLQAQAQSQAQSEAASDRRIIAGVAAVYRPEFKGSDDYEVMPFPYLNLRYPVGGMSLSLEGASLKLDLARSQTFSFGPVVSYELGRDDDITNPVVARLPTIDGAVEGGAYFDFQKRVGPGAFSAGVTALADLSGVHEGYSVGLNAGYRMPLTRKLSLGVGAEVKWADEKYMQTYYGVDSAGAAASGLPGFTAEAGLEKAGVNVNLAYQVTDRWGVAVIGGYDRLMDSAEASPIVSLQGSRDQYTSAVAVYYRF